MQNTLAKAEAKLKQEKEKGNELPKWYISEETPPPEYCHLVGRSNDGTEYVFHCTRLDTGPWIFLDGALAPVPDPVLWRYMTDKEREEMKE